MIRFLTSGESHGTGTSVVIDGLPAGLHIQSDFINNELKRRQTGYGRSERMKLESDTIEILSGVRNLKTIGAPVHIFIRNRDVRVNDRTKEPVVTPRPGHADLAGLLKYGFSDIQDVIERASARETVARVCAGAIFKLVLKEFKILISSRLISVGGIVKKREIRRIIEQTRKKGDTLGGVVMVYADNVIPGLGSYTQFDKRLDARIGMVMLSIPSVKAVEIGDAIRNAARYGSEVHDRIFYNTKKGYFRNTNHAGGIEGGVTNGERIVVTLYVKPVPTLQKPLKTVDIKTLMPARAYRTRADVCVVESVGVIGEAMLAYILADAVCEKFGSDCLNDIKKSYQQYLKRIGYAG